MLTQLIGREQIHLIKGKYSRDLIGLGSGKEAVNKYGAGHRVSQRDNQYSLVKISGNNLELLGEVACPAYDVILARFNGTHNWSIATLVLDLHDVAHSHRIGAAQPLETEHATHLAVHRIAIIETDSDPATSILYD